MVGLPYYRGLLDKKEYVVRIYHNQTINLPDLSEVVFLNNKDLERIIYSEEKNGKEPIGLYKR